MYSHIRGNFAKPHQRIYDKALISQYETKTLEPVLEHHSVLVDKLTAKEDDVEAIEKEFADYGTYEKDVKFVQGEFVSDANGFIQVNEDMEKELSFT